MDALKNKKFEIKSGKTESYYECEVTEMVILFEWPSLRSAVTSHNKMWCLAWMAISCSNVTPLKSQCTMQAKLDAVEKRIMNCTPVCYNALPCQLQKEFHMGFLFYSHDVISFQISLFAQELLRWGKLQHAWAFCRQFKSLLSSYLPLLQTNICNPDGVFYIAK